MNKFSLNEMHGSHWRVRVLYDQLPAGMLSWLAGVFDADKYWTNAKDCIYFADPEELTLFLLRWS